MSSKWCMNECARNWARHTTSALLEWFFLLMCFMSCCRRFSSLKWFHNFQVRSHSGHVALAVLSRIPSFNLLLHDALDKSFASSCKLPMLYGSMDLRAKWACYIKLVTMTFCVLCNDRQWTRDKSHTALQDVPDDSQASCINFYSLWRTGLDGVGGFALQVTISTPRRLGQRADSSFKAFRLLGSVHYRQCNFGNMEPLPLWKDEASDGQACCQTTLFLLE